MMMDDDCIGVGWRVFDQKWLFLDDDCAVLVEGVLQCCKLI